MDRHAKLQRAEDKIQRLSGQGLDVVAFWRACTPVLADAVPHYMAPCCYTLDPASLLITSHFQEGLPEFPPEWAAAEYAEDDVNHLADVARTPSGISTLHEATGGDPSSSPRWHANMAYGGDQEMVAALRTRSGEVWGSLGLYREPDRPLFDAAELAFVRAVSRRWPTASGGGCWSARRPIRRARRRPAWSCSARTGGRSRSRRASRLAGRAARRRSAAAGCRPRCWRSPAGLGGRRPGPSRPGEVAEARVLTRSGRWVVLHGVAMVAAGAARGWRSSSSRLIRPGSRRC